MRSHVTDLMSKIREKTIAMLDEKLLTHYVPLQGVAVNKEERLDLAATITRSFDKEHAEVAVLLGDSGAGKSWFGQHLVWQYYHQEESNRLVLWIPLLSIENPSKSLLTKHLRDNLLLDGDEIGALQKSKIPLRIILDGYDEINTKDNLFQTNVLARWGGRNRAQVLITCRKETLGGDIRGHEPRFWGANKKIVAYEVAAFDEKQIAIAVEHYVANNNVAWDVEEYLTKLKRIPEVEVFLQRPILLRLVLDALPAIIAKVEGHAGSDEKEKGKSNIKITTKHIKLTRQKIYSIAMEQWFRRQAEKLSQQGIKDESDVRSIEVMLEKFTRDLALAFFQHRCNVLKWLPEQKEKIPGLVNFSSQSQEKQEIHNPEWARAFFDEKENPAIHWLLKGCPIHTLGPNRYAFLHKSLLEFFAAEHLFNGALIDGWIITGRNLNVGNLQEEPQILSFLADSVKDSEEFEQVLFNIIATSKYAPDAWAAAANAVTVLNRARVNFSERNFRRVRLGGKDEKGRAWGADLTRAVLGNADLREADLRFVNLSQAYLDHANLSGACMDKVQFGEGAYLRGEVFTYSADAALLAVVDKEKSWRGINYYITIYGGEEKKVIKRWWMQGQKKKVSCLTFSPDSKQLASGSEEEYEGGVCRICIWDIHTTYCQATLEGHSWSIMSLSYRSDGKQLASGSKDGTIRLWDLASGRCESILKAEMGGGVWSVSYKEDGIELASGHTDGIIRLWDLTLSEYEPKRILKGHQRAVASVSYRHDSKHLASGSLDHTIRLWNLDFDSGHCRILEGHTNWVNCVVYRGDDKQLASGSWDNTVRLWDVESGCCVAVLGGHTEAVTNICYYAEGLQLASMSNDKTLRFWSNVSSRKEAIFEGHTKKVSSMSYRGDGKQLVSGGYDRKICLWDFASGRCDPTLLKGHKNDITAVSYRVDGKQIASGSKDFSICLWDLACGKCEITLEGHTGVVTSVSYSNEGNQLASSSNDKTVRLWNIISGNCEVTFKGHTETVTSVSYRGDGLQLASSSDDTTIRLWNLVSQQEEATLKGHEASVAAISYRSDNRQLVSSSHDKTIRFWDLETFKCQITLKNHNALILSLAYHPKKFYFAFGDEVGAFGLWDSVTYQRLACWSKQHNGSSLTSLTWSPSGKHLATGCSDGMVSLWGLKKEKNVINPYLFWRAPSHKNLTAVNLNLSQVTGLSSANYALLQQRGSVIGELSKTRKSKKVIKERNAQIYIPSGKLDQPWLDNLQEGSFIVTPKHWLLALVRKTVAGCAASASGESSGQHVWIVVQGITEDHYSVIKEIHFFLDGNKPTKYHNSIGTGLIQIRDKSPFELKRQMEEGELAAKIWGVSRDTVMNELLPAIERDQAREIGYLITGHAPSLIFKAGAYSCLSWCVKQLQDIGLSVEPEVGWFNCIFAMPPHYLPATENDAGKKIEEKQKKKGKEKEKEQDAEPDSKCRIM